MLYYTYFLNYHNLLLKRHIIYSLSGIWTDIQKSLLSQVDISSFYIIVYSTMPGKKCCFQFRKIIWYITDSDARPGFSGIYGYLLWSEIFYFYGEYSLSIFMSSCDSHFTSSPAKRNYYTFFLNMKHFFTFVYYYQNVIETWKLLMIYFYFIDVLAI